MTNILIPKPFNDKKQTQYEQKKLRKAHKQRAAIEPIIGHLKTDHRLGRNFYKGIVGDNINILLAAAAFNFKRMMNKWKVSICQFLNIIIFQIILVENQFSKNYSTQNIEKLKIGGC